MKLTKKKRLPRNGEPEPTPRYDACFAQMVRNYEPAPDNMTYLERVLEEASLYLALTRHGRLFS